MWASLSYFRHIALIGVICWSVFTGCDSAGEPIVPDPENVRMVHHNFSDDTLAVERGIDAVWENDGIFLAWYDLRDRNIKQYNIYRRRDDESYFRLIKNIILAQSDDTTFVDDNGDDGLSLNVYYHYYVTAINSNDEESGAADTLKYMLLAKPETRQPDGQTFSTLLDTLPILQWDFVDIPNFYILRIENNFGQLHFSGLYQVTEFFESQTLDLETIEELPPFDPGIYKWRIDVVGPDEGERAGDRPRGRV